MSDFEKKFDINCKRMIELNKLLYEYESLSMESYSSDTNKYLGKNKFNTDSIET